jgi:hypothetical protein
VVPPRLGRPHGEGPNGTPAAARNDPDRDVDGPIGVKGKANPHRLTGEVGMVRPSRAGSQVKVRGLSPGRRSKDDQPAADGQQGHPCGTKAMRTRSRGLVRHVFLEHPAEQSNRR